MTEIEEITKTFMCYLLTRAGKKKCVAHLNAFLDAHDSLRKRHPTGKVFVYGFRREYDYWGFDYLRVDAEEYECHSLRDAERIFWNEYDKRGSEVIVCFMGWRIHAWNHMLDLENREFE